MPASKFATQNQFYLPNSIFYQTITGGWAEDTEAVGYTEPDMVLKPDYATASAAPWTADWTLQVIHDAFSKEGEPVPFAPRNVLKRVVALYEAKGWTPVVAPEMEFFPGRPQHRPGAGDQGHDRALGATRGGAAGLFDLGGG